MANRSAMDNPNKSMLYKNDLKDIKLSEYKVLDPAPSNTELSEVAKSLGYEPETLDLSTTKEKVSEIYHDLRSAKSFGEMDGKLSNQDLWMEKRDAHIAFTDGFTKVNAEKVDPDFKISNLNKKFGEDISKYLDLRDSEIDISGAEQKVQGLFDKETIKDLKTKRNKVKSEISEIRYELATIKTAPKKSRDVKKQEKLVKLKSNLLKKHQNLSSEIASLTKKERISPKIDNIKFQASQVKLAAGKAAGSFKAIKNGLKININATKGMQAARNVIAFQKGFKNLAKTGAQMSTGKVGTAIAVTKTSIKVAYKAFKAMERAANNAEISR